VPFIKTYKLQLILTIGFGLCLLYYVIYKATHTSFTHDESYSFLKYVHQPFMDIISYKTAYTNNHILNSVLMKYSEVCFGNSELAMRLPNILAFVLYASFVFAFLKRFLPSIIFFGFIVFTAHPYLLDFFALARGYGLSIAFMVMSIYYLCVYFYSNINKHLVLFNVAAFFAVMSNFSMLNFYVASLITFNVVSYFKNKTLNQNHQWIKQNKINLWSLLVFIAFLFEPMRRIAKKKLLDFGGKQGFITDTIGSSVDDLFYESHVIETWLTIFKCFVVFVVFVVTLIWLVNSVKKRIDFIKDNSVLLIVNILLLCIVGISIAQHVLLDNDFYVHRFALFFYPLFILNLIVLFKTVFDLGFKKTLVFVFFILSVGSVYNLYLNGNVSYYKDWKYDQHTKSVMTILIDEQKNNAKNHKRLGVTWLLEPSTNFYRYTWNLDWMSPTHRRGLSKYDDYWYILQEDENFNKKANKPTLFSDNKIGSFLVKNTD